MGSLSERELIELWRRRLPEPAKGTVVGVGDDAAVLETEPGTRLLVSSDMMVEGIHFSLDWMTLQDVGFKAVSAAVSDIAAMGGSPRHVLVSVGVPRGGASAEAAGALYDGVAEACGRYGVDVVGGDTVASPERWVIDVLVLGEAEPGLVMTRAGGRPGDLLVVTGSLGGAAAGLDWLRGGGRQVVTTPEERWVLLDMHRRPVAQVEMGRILAACGATACDDVTDGLAAELRELHRAGGFGFFVESGRIPIHPAVRNYALRRGLDPVQWALFGGEDYQLLACLPPGRLATAQACCRAVGGSLTVIGRVTEDPALLWRNPRGLVEELPEGGYDHFASGGTGSGGGEV